MTSSLSPRQRAVSRARRSWAARAMTLIEILVVLAIIGLVMGAIVAGSGQTSSARLRQSSALVSGAVRVAYARASATSRPVRLVFDFANKTISLEESSAPMLVQSKDKTGTGGADPATVAEQEALAETQRLTKGPATPRPTFKAVVEQGFGKGPKPLPNGIEFRSVETAHDDVARTEGRAYLYFWPGGQTERAVVQLRIGAREDDDGTLSLVVSPLTGKVAVKTGVVPLKLPENEAEASEREAPGGF